jgi:hypothetical protein
MILMSSLGLMMDMSTYRTNLFPSVSIQSCRAKSDRVGSDAVYAFLFPNLAINRYGDWLLSPQCQSRASTGLL